MIHLLTFYFVANGDGSREPTVKELEIATTQGENFAKLLNTFHRGLEIIDDKQAEGVQKNAVIEEAVPATGAAVTPTSRAIPEATTSVTTEEPSIKEVEPVPVKEELKSESKPKAEEKTAVVEEKPVAKPTAPQPTPKKEEKKESKCFCM